MMDPTLQAETLALLIDRLIGESDPRVQERMFVEEICKQGWAQSAALLRETGTNGEWIEVLARGPQDLLPTPDQVGAMDSGELPAELPLGKRTLFASDQTGGVALGLGGCAESETEDVLGALLEVFCRFSVTCGEPAWDGLDLLDMLQPPTPGGAQDEGQDESADESF